MFDLEKVRWLLFVLFAVVLILKQKHTQL
ncbi:hypothetical protein B2K_01160 [Paenibacillus mucilaginosus K02]|nr:hypothetical protein B2K_01160 [Paenibacillus mucilaginosus K02]